MAVGDAAPSAGAATGAQDTALQPIACALNGLDDSHCPSLVSEIVETLPSDDAHARIAPSSWGAHAIEFTERRKSERGSEVRARIGR